MKNNNKFYFNGEPISLEEIALLPKKIINLYKEQHLDGQDVKSITFNSIKHPKYNRLVKNHLKRMKKPNKQEKESKRNAKRLKLVNQFDNINETISKDKKKFKAEKKQKRRENNLKRFAERLNINVPKSEQWFREIYEPYRDIHDQFNLPFMGKIPDLINEYYKYIIEIDGSFHDLPKQIAKDIKKDKLFKSHGYEVIRVKAYDMQMFNDCIDLVKSIRTQKEKQLY